MSYFLHLQKNIGMTEKKNFRDIQEVMNIMNAMLLMMGMKYANKDVQSLEE